VKSPSKCCIQATRKGYKITTTITTVGMMIAGLDHDIQARRDVYEDSWLDCRDYQRDAWSLACREWKGEE